MDIVNLGLIALLFIGIIAVALIISNKVNPLRDEDLDLDWNEEPITLLGVVLPKDKETGEKKNEKK